NAQGARHHRFDRNFISSGVLRRNRSLLPAAALFSRGIRFTGAHRRGETISISSDRGQLRALSRGRAGLLFLVAAKNDSFFLSRHRIARLGTDVDSAAVLFVRNTIHHWIWSGV